MDDRDIIGRFEYVQLLVWIVVLAVPVALLTLRYLTIYKQGILIYESLAVVKLFTLSICLATGFPGGFVFPLFFSAGALGYAIHLMMPLIPLPICIIGMTAGIGGAVMRMPFTVILLLMLLTNPTLFPISTFSAVTSYLAAGILDAGSVRKAMRQAGDERREFYVGEKEARSALVP